jgi:hypothetical protein
VHRPFRDRYRSLEFSRPLRESIRHTAPACLSRSLALLLMILIGGHVRLRGSDKPKIDYGAGLTMTITLPEPEVASVVEEIAGNGIIRGTKEYNKDEYVTGAVPVASTRAFPPWTGGGKVYYKIREHAIDPRNFKDSGDVGTLAVRYVVQSQGDAVTVVQINAIFLEDFRRTAHPSDGSVESSEFRDIQEHLDAIELMKKETAEAEKNQRQDARKKLNAQVTSGPPPGEPMTGYLKSQYRAADVDPVPAQAPGQSLKEYAQVLRKQATRVVKTPGAPLKSAPFQSASIIQDLPSGTEVLIVISTPYWSGVETHDGVHGWLSREQLELLP